jgi:hypothetical protein
MPSSPAERYPHPDCTSDEAPAGDVLSGSGPEVTAFIEENSCRRVLTQEVQSACGYPAARSGRTVETGELPVKALDATERAAGLPGKGDHSEHAGRPDAERFGQVGERAAEAEVDLGDGWSGERGAGPADGNRVQLAVSIWGTVRAVSLRHRGPVKAAVLAISSSRSRSVFALVTPSPTVPARSRHAGPWSLFRL